MKSDTLTINTVNNLKYISFPKLDATNLVANAFSTRFGGVSRGIYSSMNFSFTNGDDTKNVEQNYKIICNALKIDPCFLTLSHQTHTDNIRIISEDDIGKGYCKPRDYDDIDALITNIPKVCLVTQFADCVPLLFLDKEKKVIAAAHAGWKGTVAQIGLKTVNKMCEHFGCDPKNIIAAIGPSIMQCCYEVDDPVIDRFKTIDYISLSQITTKKSNGKYMLNLTKANQIILEHSGIKSENIDINDLCTCCNADVFHSHRKTNGLRGNNAAFIALR